jgi:hypothetical protein
MVQTYGVAAEDARDAHGDTEASALLGADVTNGKPPQKFTGGHASLVSCVGNLANTIIGSGEPSSG